MTWIRNLTKEDIPAVTAMEERCFGDNWSSGIVESSIGQAMKSEEAWIQNGAADPVSYGAIGLFTDRKLIGYLFAMSVIGEGELHRIAILPEMRGQGLSILLMDEFFVWLKKQKDNAVTLEVRGGNTPAISLYQKYGFQEEGRRKNYYKNPTEDAVIMWNHALILE